MLLSTLALLLAASLPTPQMVLVPGQTFDMGCHDTLGTDDEFPVHTVTLDSFRIGNLDVNNGQYCAYLNWAWSQGRITVSQGLVCAAGDTHVLCEVAGAVDSGSSVFFSGDTFTVGPLRDNHPMVCVRWLGAAAYCNWLSAESGYSACYDLAAGNCDFAQGGFRLPTEAEWECAARGHQYTPYYTFPWGNNRDTLKTNWPQSGDPYEAGPNPWTTPCGFYNGELHQKADFQWPGSQTSYQTSDGANGYGLYDMAGDVWNWCNDWYGHTYYSSSPPNNPHGPDTGSVMPDGHRYRVLRGGSWYNATHWHGDHSRCSNRDPAYYRGPGDPNGPWFHIGFRVARNGCAVAGTAERPTPGESRLRVTSPFRVNAAIRFTAAADVRAEAVIVDMMGRAVRHLAASAPVAGRRSLTWDGRDDAGRPVAPGVYYCSLRAGSATRSAKLVKLD